MTRVHCMACGKSYNYETNGCCPNCGAYNRPPRRQGVNADGTVYRITDREYADSDSPLREEKQGKVCFESKECYEEKSCFEEKARRVRQRPKVPQFMPHIDVPKRGRRGGAGKKPVSIGGLLGLLMVIVIAIASNGVARWGGFDNNQNDSWDDIWSDDWVDSEYTEMLTADLGTYFTLDGEDVRVTDWQIFGDELTFVIQGREDLGVELWYGDEDGEYSDIADFDVESLGSGAPLLDEILDGHAARYTCSINGVCELEYLMLYGDNEVAEVNTAMRRMETQEYFNYQGMELCVSDLNMEREGPSKVLDDLYLDVGILSTDNELELEEVPQLWTRTSGGIPNIVEVERAAYDYARCDLYYNLGRGENIGEMTLYFPDCGEGAYWVTLT